MHNRCVAVLGRADSPTDAVEDYCHYLASALAAQGTSLAVARVRWMEAGWATALSEFTEKFPGQENSWFLLQYTALAWSRRGFSWRFLKMIRHLKKSGARCAVVFHDAESYLGSRLVDRVRRAVQLHTMRSAARLADLAIFTIPPEKISWIATPSQKSVFIPVGANLPSPEQAWQKADVKKEAAPAVAVFSVTGGKAGTEEIKLIAAAAVFATEHIGPIHIVVLGRNSEIAKPQLQERLGSAPVQVSVHGLLSADQIVRLLVSCDVMLSVRGPISTRRGSAIAGIACGLPVIASQGWETAAPLTEAGLVLVPPEDSNNFGPALVSVLADPSFRAQLAKRSREAYARYFSWDVIASQLAEAMRECESKPESRAKRRR
jgi:glycosyltransferase involved in cell wall biosynthesis